LALSANKRAGKSFFTGQIENIDVSNANSEK